MAVLAHPEFVWIPLCVLAPSCVVGMVPEYTQGVSWQYHTGTWSTCGGISDVQKQGREGTLQNPSLESSGGQLKSQNYKILSWRSPQGSSGPAPGPAQHNPRSPTIVPMLLSSVSLGAVTTPGELFLCANTLCGKNLFPTSKRNLPIPLAIVSRIQVPGKL